MLPISRWGPAAVAGVQTLLVMANNTFNVGSLWLVTSGGVLMANDSDVAASRRQ